MGVSDPLSFAFCGIMAPKRRDICDCGSLEHMADEPSCPVEFDAKLKEYHIAHQDGGYSMIYYCPFCGGSAPKSRRGRLFQRITDAEQHRLCELTKGMRMVEDVIRAFGEPRFSSLRVTQTPR